MRRKTCTRVLSRHWRHAIVVLTPLLALAVPLYVKHEAADDNGATNSTSGGSGAAVAAPSNVSDDAAAARGSAVAADPAPPQLTERAAWCAYCIIVMAVYWMTEAIAIQATALLPVLLFPLTGVVSTKAVCAQYMTSANMLFLGGLMVAAAVEHSRLHLRIALRTLISAGAGLQWMIFGFMAVTMFLSMWISNTATTAMMTPIIEQIIRILTQESLPMTIPKGNGFTGDGAGSPAAVAGGLNKEALSAAMYISVAYAANCGGTGTLTGTNPNLVLVGQLEELFGSGPGITYASFMMFGVPAMLLCTLIAWLWLVVLFLGPRQLLCCSGRSAERERFAEVRDELQRQYRQLGPPTFHEKTVAALFVVLVVLWFLREPRFMPGWNDVFPAQVADATPAMLIVLLMFIIPAHPGTGDETLHSNKVLSWKAAQEKVQWGVIVLLGGGFAMAHAAKVTGLSEWVGGQLASTLTLPPVALVFIICLFTAFVTEVSSNTATATILLPVLASVSTQARLNPLYLMLPVTLTCSYAFMLPVATPPNAIVHQAGALRTFDMIKAGLLMNLLCVGVITLLTTTLGVALFDLQTFPAWAESGAV